MVSGAEPAKVSGITPAAPGVALMSLEDLFCDIDDFCRLFLPAWHRQLLTDSARQRQRASRLTLSEIMTILIYCLSLLVKTMDFSPKLLVYGLP